MLNQKTLPPTIGGFIARNIVGGSVMQAVITNGGIQYVWELIRKLVENKQKNKELVDKNYHDETARNTTTFTLGILSGFGWVFFAALADKYKGLSTFVREENHQSRAFAAMMVGAFFTAGNFLAYNYCKNNVSGEKTVSNKAANMRAFLDGAGLFCGYALGSALGSVGVNPEISDQVTASTRSSYTRSS